MSAAASTMSVSERRLPAGHSGRWGRLGQEVSVSERRLPAGHSESVMSYTSNQVYLSDGYPQATARLRSGGICKIVYLSDGYPQATASSPGMWARN